LQPRCFSNLEKQIRFTELSWFEQDGVAHRDFSNIVQECSVREGRHEGQRIADLSGQMQRVGTHPSAIRQRSGRCHGRWSRRWSSTLVELWRSLNSEAIRCTLPVARRLKSEIFWLHCYDDIHALRGDFMSRPGISTLV